MTGRPSAASRVPAAMRPAFRRGWVGEEKRNRRAGAGQWAKPATRGRLFPLWERKGKALVFPPNKRTDAIGLPTPRRGTKTAPLQRRNADGRPARGPLRQRVSGKARGKSASGSAQKCRAPRSAKRGTGRVRNFSRSPFPAPDRHPNGPGLQARSA